MKKEGKAVTLIVAKDKNDFINKWNQMGLDSDGKEEYKFLMFILYIMVPEIILQ